MQDVLTDRDKWIGGSDVPIIMGLSPFRTRFELLQEKAGLTEIAETSNPYTEYGKEMEGIIREYINDEYFETFEENTAIKGDIRYHADGFNGTNCVLEIKTTSHPNHKAYMVQLLTGMVVNEVPYGMLAIYDRPDDFSTEFDPDRLQVKSISIDSYQELIQEIETELLHFRFDLEKVKANPFITEEELLPTEIVEYADEITELETQLMTYKLIEQRYKSLKAELKAAMSEYGIKSWVTNNGYKFTLVPDGEDSEELKFDTKLFKEEHPKLYKKYCSTVTKKGKAGYVRITPPKED